MPPPRSAPDDGVPAADQDPHGLRHDRGEAPDRPDHADRPTPGTDRPTPETDRPTSGTDRPTPETDRPTSGTDRPTPETDRPTSGTDRPTPKTDRPTPETDRPTPETDRPTSGTDRPSPGQDRSFPGQDRPSSPGQSPADRPPPPPESPPEPPRAAVPRLGHGVLKSLLGAWALAACSAEETAAVEEHLTDCAPCADEALRLRDAVRLLHPEDNLDLDPLLRSRVLEGCLGRRPARIPVPGWAAPYDAETARLDALLNDMGEAEWRAPVRLTWYDGRQERSRDVTVAGVVGHLMTVDGMVATALGLGDPLGDATPADGPATPTGRTEAYWHRNADAPPGEVRERWREQSHTLVRTVSFAGGAGTERTVPYGPVSLPLSDAFLDRAFGCWVHAGDIADAVDYPYEPPAPAHLHRMIDLAVRVLPEALAARRRKGLAGPPRELVTAGSPGRTLHLEVEGSGGGHWYVALDSPAAVPSPEHAVAHVALDGAEFCRLAAGHVPPEEAAAGQDGDREAIRDVLSAAASLSRL
ncbi:hypothetical protein GCU69_32245 [Streptomyces lycii]|uniref:MDMPI N domain containing protein n=1 Tax=Streptomyces lycii TaxID=2654337 RepID=A0ABQ7FA25_9ACTN|nr:hypothetical protein GCU69_32245 [Streptomyces lycii]